MAGDGGGGGALEHGTSGGAQQGLRMCSAWDVWPSLLNSTLPLSPHLPLHRTAGAFLQGVDHVAVCSCLWHTKIALSLLLALVT